MWGTREAYLGQEVSVVRDGGPPRRDIVFGDDVDRSGQELELVEVEGLLRGQVVVIQVVSDTVQLKMKEIEKYPSLRNTNDSLDVFSFERN